MLLLWGKTTADACKEIWCRHQACFQWRQESGTARSHGIGHQIGRSVVAIDLCAMPVRDSRWRWQLPVKDVGHSTVSGQLLAELRFSDMSPLCRHFVGW